MRLVMIQIVLSETLRQPAPMTSKLNSQGFEDLPVLDLLSRALPPQEHRQGIKFVPYYGGNTLQEWFQASVGSPQGFSLADNMASSNLKLYSDSLKRWLWWYAQSSHVVGLRLT
jgi:hypothetical protein